MRLYTQYTNPSEIEKDLNDLQGKIDELKDSIDCNQELKKQIDDSINDIGFKIKRTKKNNKKIVRIRKIKGFKALLRATGPYIITASLLFGIQTLIGDVPYYPQKHFQDACYTNVYDNHGREYSEKTYHYDDDEDLFKYIYGYYVTPWELKEDGKYYRTTKEYQIDKSLLEDIKKNINNPLFRLEDYSGVVTDISHEVEKKVSEEELNEGSVIKITMRYTNNEDVMLVAQGFGSNFCLTGLHILIVGLVWLIQAAIIDSYHDDCKENNTKYFTLESALNKLKKEYKELDIEQYINLLEDKKMQLKIMPHREVQTQPLEVLQTSGR